MESSPFVICTILFYYSIDGIADSAYYIFGY